MLFRKTKLSFIQFLERRGKTPRGLSALCNNREGIAALEFAMVMPMLIVFYLGVVEITGYLTVSRRADLANNAMAQILADVGGGDSGTMHWVWQVPAQVNPTSNFEYNWGDGDTWRNPFSFSQVVWKNEDPTCTSSCNKVAKRDFMFAFAQDRSCEVNVLSQGQGAEKNTDIPFEYNAREKPMMMVSHTAQYKPIISAKFFNSGSAKLDITNVAFTVRHDGAIYSYPPNGHGMYKFCDGTTGS